MEKRKRIGAKPIDLSYIQVRQPEHIEEYNLEEDTLGGFELEELEELGAISYPKTKKIPDGEIDFIKAFKQGEDW